MLRDFQEKFKADIYAAWDQGAKNVLGVAPTGSGKTVVMASVVRDKNVPTCAIAHRQELVSQISLAFNREEIPHDIIAPPLVVRDIIAAQMDLHGKSYYRQNAAVRVAGVDSFRNYDTSDRWLGQVRLAIQDEGHHVLRDNKWGKAMARLPNSLGLFLTAHALRPDGRGLGRDSDGLADELVVGPSGRAIINRGYLTDYRIVCPPSDIQVSDLKPGASGEFVHEQVAARVHASTTIVGDVVKHYRKFAEGELGITFAVDIKACYEIQAAFEKARIPAAIISHKTGISERTQIMRRYRERKLIQLINVDCLGEGTDVPACTVVSMVQPSASFQRVAQQFGRMLRISVSDELNRIWYSFTDAERLAHIAASSKPRGILIDHVGNIAVHGGRGRHGLPDCERVYSLDRLERKSRSPEDVIPQRPCLNPECLLSYETVLSECPYCGTPKPKPALRGSPEHVEGDLFELDPSVLREMRGEIDRIDAPPLLPNNISDATAGAIRRNHWERQQSQIALRDAIATWAGWQKHLARSEREAHRRFWFEFGVDVATAQTLGVKPAAELEARIRMQLASNNVVKQ